MNLANKLTLLRITIIPFFVIAFYADTRICVILFLVASITDYLDGLVARKFSLETQFGKFLDPVADKLLVVSALFLLAASYQSVLITVASMLIVSREIAVSSLREWLSSSQRGGLPVSFWGKLKTTLQLLAIVCLLYANNLDNPLGMLGLWLLCAATLLTWVSFGEYLWHHRGILVGT